VVWAKGMPAPAAATSAPPCASTRSSEGSPYEIVSGGRAFQVVKGQIPPELAEGLQRDFTEDEKMRIACRIHKTQAASTECPAALWLFGPSAVGKSSIKNAQASARFGSPEAAVVVDGADFREVHAGWQAVTAHGIRNHVLHADAWKLFKDFGKGKGGSKEGISGQLKQSILSEAIADRQNLVIPDCATSPLRVHAQLEDLAKAGYELHGVCMWAPLSETRARGEPRSVSEGKLWSPKDYDSCVATVLEISSYWQNQMAERPAIFKSLSAWDNTTYPAREISFDELSYLTALSHEEAEKHARTCKEMQELASQHARRGGLQAINIHELLQQEGGMDALRTSLSVRSSMFDGTGMGADLEAARASAFTPFAQPGGTRATQKAVTFQRRTVTRARMRGRLEGTLFGAVATAIVALVVVLAMQS